jgi:MFS transporter, DHA1 family, multidrug resistance protein
MSSSEVIERPSRTEFVLLIASVMMIVAFAIDSMLPALPAIGNSLHVAQENQRQFVISAFLGGFGISLLFVGILSDRFGRRRLILPALIGFAMTSLMAAFAPTFELLLAARVLQGMMAAGAQVTVRSVVRDRFEGRDMAQVMSLASMIFMAAPIIAPTMGQIVLIFGPWRWIFGILGVIGIIVWGWVYVRMPETLAPENRRKISRAQIWASAKIVVGDRYSLGYGLAIALINGALFGFLLSVQQIFEHVLNQPDFLPTGFAIMAGGMAVASLVNASIVRRFGMRLIGHWALIFYTVLAGIHWLVALSGHETMLTFIALQSVMMLGFSLIMGNFSAMAMENMGKVAGMANSLQGSLANFFGMTLGSTIGQLFNGTTVPLYGATLACGALALLTVYMTEGGRFFVARHKTETGG